jgi:hypothetical protein
MLRPRLWLLVLAAACTAVAEIVHVHDFAIPKPISLEVRQLVYVASDPSGQKAQIDFSDFHASGTDKANVFVGVADWQKLLEAKDRTAIFFCSVKDGQLDLPGIVSSVNIVDRQVAATLSGSISETSVYSIFVANCGETSGGTVSGTMSIKGTAGYIPGHERFELAINCAFAVCFLLVAVWWLIQIFSAEESLEIYHTLSCLVLAGFGETFFQSLHYGVVAMNGEDSVLISVAAAFSVTKVSLSILTLFVVAKIGEQGATSSCNQTLVACLAALFIVPRLCVGIERHSFLTPLTQVLGTTALAATGITVALCCTVRDLSASMTSAREVNHETILKGLQQTCVVMILMSITTAGVAFMDFFNRPDMGTSGWNFHSVAVVFPHQLVFTLSVVYMMYVWMPGQASLSMNTIPQDEEELTGLKADKIGAPVQAE